MKKELKAEGILSRIKKTPQDIFRYSNRDFDSALLELEELKLQVESMKNCYNCNNYVHGAGYSNCLLEFDEMSKCGDEFLQWEVEK